MTHWSDRLWLLSMMSLGCVAGGSSDGDGTTNTTGGSSGRPMTDDGPTSTGAVDSTSNGGSTGSTSGTSTTATEEGTTYTGTGVNTDTEGGSTASSGSTTDVEPLSPYVEACAALFTTYQDCFGGRDSPEMIVEHCVEEEFYMSMYYSEVCLAAQTDHNACLSELACAEFDGTLPDACLPTHQAGEAVCPELFLFCFGGFGGSNAGECSLGAFDCIDGNEYSVTCDATTCTCTINDVAVDTFPSTGPNVCDEPGFGDVATSACSFPDGILL